MTSQMLRLLEKSRASCRSLNLTRETPVLAAVSGGVDSMCAAAVVKLLSRTEKVKLVGVAYVCHCIRTKKEINADKKAVQLLALRLGVPFMSGCTDTCGSNNNETISRVSRYEKLKEFAKKVGAEVVVTGHHANDQAETVLARVFKGASRDAMRCIRPTVFLGNGMFLWRPLLKVSKSSIVEAMEREYGNIWVADSTNSDDTIERNWIRNVVIPQIQQRYGDNATERISRIAAMLQREPDGV